MNYITSFRRIGEKRRQLESLPDDNESLGLSATRGESYSLMKLLKFLLWRIKIEKLTKVVIWSFARE